MHGHTSFARPRVIGQRVLALSFSGLAFLAMASAQSVTTFDATETSTNTYPTAINLSGTVAGYYIDATGFHGFQRSPNGSITTFNPPADSTLSGTATLFGLNSSGEVAGTYINASTFLQTGYLRDASGNFTDIIPPGSTLVSVNGINDAGVIAGTWVDSSKPAKTHGFVRSATGTYTSFDVTGDSGGIDVASINNSGTIAGFYYDSSSHSHGFVRSASGTITTFSAPSPYINLIVYAMNDAGQIIGEYNNGQTQTATYVGYLRQGTTLTSIEANPDQTFPEAINSSGTITGYDCVAFNNCNGFVRNTAGTITPLNVTNASNTQPDGVNALGTIAGIWLDQSFARHGFIASFTQSSPPSSGTACNGTYDTTFSGNLIVSAGQTCNFVGGAINGNVTLLGGALGLSGATVSGGVQIAGGTFSIGPSTTINGSVLILDIGTPTGQNQVCGATIRGGVQLLLNDSALAIGQGTAACPGNTIGGDVDVLNSLAATSIVDNNISGNLVCAANSSISGSGNIVRERKEGQCAAF